MQRSFDDEPPQPTEPPTVLHGKTMPELMDEYTFTEQQLAKAIQYT